ncbi:MAG: response regulator [Methylococcales bacterium]|nr:response regulator [Methylococcales bacterium]MBT7408958.1 response regulator [Methylococcales bacterium]
MARVLIVDDSPTETHVLKSILEKNGYGALSAANGEEGIETAKKEQPDLILMDVVMPGLNGYQATRRLSRDPLTASIPVIIVTTKNQETDKVWGLRQGAKGYIVKPVSEVELITRIKMVLTQD